MAMDLGTIIIIAKLKLPGDVDPLFGNPTRFLYLHYVRRGGSDTFLHLDDTFARLLVGVIHGLLLPGTV